MYFVPHFGHAKVYETSIWTPCFQISAKTLVCTLLSIFMRKCSWKLFERIMLFQAITTFINKFCKIFFKISSHLCCKRASRTRHVFLPFLQESVHPLLHSAVYDVGQLFALAFPVALQSGKRAQLEDKEGVGTVVHDRCDILVHVRTEKPRSRWLRLLYGILHCWLLFTTYRSHIHEKTRH